MKEGKLEESILDFFVMNSDVLPFIKQMVIDDKKEHILTNYRKVGKSTDSDHFTQYMDLNLEFLKEKPIRQEMFNFKNEKSQKLFKTQTSETLEFTNCFEGGETLEKQVENWREVLNSYCKKSFKKIRIKKEKIKKISPKIKALINKRN